VDLAGSLHLQLYLHPAVEESGPEQNTEQHTDTERRTAGMATLVAYYAIRFPKTLSATSRWAVQCRFNPGAVYGVGL
jgi:hypothetical protein